MKQGSSNMRKGHLGRDELLRQLMSLVRWMDVLACLARVSEEERVKRQMKDESLTHTRKLRTISRKWSLVKVLLTLISKGGRN